MKILIWFGCIFGLNLVIVILKNMGIMLGGIPTILLYAGMFGLAETLCRKWSENKDKGDNDGKN